MGSTRTRWSQCIPYRTDEERDWLLRALWRQQYPSVDCGDERDLYRCCSGITLYAEKKRILVHESDTGNIEGLLDIVSEFETTFDSPLLWYISWGVIDLHMKVGSFGGGAAIVYKGRVERMSTEGWIEDKTELITQWLPEKAYVID